MPQLVYSGYCTGAALIIYIKVRHLDFRPGSAAAFALPIMPLATVGILSALNIPRYF